MLRLEYVQKFASSGASADSDGDDSDEDDSDVGPPFARAYCTVTDYGRVCRRTTTT